MKNSIARELVKLVQAESHLKSLENVYDEVIKQNVSLSSIQLDDFDIRYMSVQHLANFDEITNEDLEMHPLGYGIKMVKRQKVIAISKNKDRFIANIRSKTKNNILSIFRDSERGNYQNTTFEGVVGHYFLASRYMLNFDILLDSSNRSVLVKNIFRGAELDNNTEFPQAFKKIIGSYL